MHEVSLGVDVESGMVHHANGTAANVADVTQVARLLHADENAVYAHPGYTSVEKRDEHGNREVIWQIAGPAQHLLQVEQAKPALQGQAQEEIL